MKSKIATLRQAVAKRALLKRNRAKVVFTNGCFDVVHAGHVEFLAAARRLGDFLIVGLNSDASVKRLKGPGRPVMSFADRALLLSSLIPVDMVVEFRDDTPIDLIKRLKPEVLAKGADYAVSEIVGADEVLGWGGKVRRIRLIKGKSTSKIIGLLKASKR